MAPGRDPDRSKPVDFRRLHVAFALVALCFVLSTLFAQARTLSVDSEVATLAENGLPSIEELSTVNDSLRRIEVLADQFGDGPDGRRPGVRAAIVDERARVDAHLAAYTALPTFEGEKERYADVTRSLHEVDGALARLYGAVGDGERMAHIADEDVRGAVARASETLRALLAINVTGSRVAASRITVLQRSAARWAVAFDALGMVLAVVAAFVAAGLFRRQSEPAEQNRALLARRAEDLERFAQHVAHDLVSPLSALSVRLDRIQRRGGEVPGIEDSVRQAKACVLRATRMTRGIFEFSRGADSHETGSAEVAPVLAGVAEDVRLSADPVEPQIALDVADPLTVACTPGVLTSILGNLLDNAVKHGQRGGTVRVDVRAHAVGDRVRIEIQDHGPGLPPGSETSIFEPYVRVPGTTAAGIGIGLATVKRLVEGHGGHVTVSSTYGSGCTFVVDLPSD